MATTIIRMLEVTASKIKEEALSPAKAVQIMSDNVISVVADGSGSKTTYTDGKRYSPYTIEASESLAAITAMAKLFQVTVSSFGGVTFDTATAHAINIDRIVDVASDGGSGSVILYKTSRRYDPIEIVATETPAQVTSAVNLATDIVLA